MSCKCLRDIKDPHVDIYGCIIYQSGSSINTTLYEVLDSLIYTKHGVYNLDKVLSLGRVKNQGVNLKPSPPHLFLHLGNVTNDNKNHYLLMFLSLLATLGISSLLSLYFFLWDIPMKA